MYQKRDTEKLTQWEIVDYIDVKSLYAYQMMLDEAKTPEQALAIIQAKSRNSSRTPMQWEARKNTGFAIGGS